MLGGAVTLAFATLAFAVIAYGLDVHFRHRRQGRQDGIVEISRPAHPKFDIVAVHGLGANPKLSWTSKVSKSELEGDLAGWESLSDPIKEALKEMAHKFGVDEKTQRISLLDHVLKPEFPEARILSFCYNSDWFINAPVVTAKQIGDRLLGELAKVRSTNLSTPIIFIGHSFGGIVIKQALLAAKEDAKENIVDSTCGIVFLGTPHYGSSLSTPAAALAFASGVLGSDTTLLFGLRSRSVQLSDLEKEFRTLGNNQEGRRAKLKIVSFCETMPTRALGLFSIGLTVDASSAQGCAPDIYEVDVNHVDLNKSPKMYTKLTNVLHNLKPQSKPSLNPIQQDVEDRLKPLGDAIFDPKREESEEDSETVCHPYTRVDLLQRIMNWTTGTERKYILWLRGKAGTGKSTISRTIARKLIEKDYLIASFFFKRNTDRANSDHLFPTIANQLNRRLPSMSQHVLDEMKDAKTTSPVAKWKREYQFQELILEPLRKIDKDSKTPMAIFVVIDALDECDSQENVEKILHVLLNVKQHVEQLSSIKVKYLITSRPEDYIRNVMENKRFSDHWKEESLDQEPKTEHDISVFVRSSLKKFLNDLNHKHTQQSQSLPASWPSEDKTTGLIKMTVPLFIFAATACRFIKDQRMSGDPDERLERILKQKITDHNSQIAATYLPALEQMIYGLSNIEKDESIREFKESVGWIVLLTRPLSAESFANLLGIKISIVDKRLNWLHSVLNVPSDSKIPVTLFHQSFREFLISPELAKDFFVNETEVHKKLHRRCLIQMEDLKKDICCQKKPGTLQKHIDKQVVDKYLKPEVQYACLYWVEHLRKSGSKIDDKGQVHTFLKKHLLHWLEALGWMGKVSDGVHAISSLNSTMATEGCNDLSAFLYDIERFIRKNRACIEEAPLQAYCSALVFAPENSIIRNKFETDMPPWINQLPIVDKNWSDLLQTLEGHSDCVEAVAFSPDGTLLASGSRDNTVRLWDGEFGMPVATFKGHTDCVFAITFSPDGTRLASCSSGGAVKIWNGNGQSDKAIATYQGHTDWVYAITFSPDGTRLASCSYDKTVMLWDANKKSVSYEAVATFKGHINSVTAITFSPDGTRLASCSWDGTVKIWNGNGQSDKAIATYQGHTDWVYAITFSPDGTQLASCSEDKTVKIWDGNGQSDEAIAIFKGHTDWVYAITFSPDGTQLASCSDDKTVKLWDAIGQSDEAVETLKLGATVKQLSFSSNGSYLNTNKGVVRVKPDKRMELGLFVPDKWIMLGSHELLWLPEEHRATCVVVEGERIILGHSSGRLSDIRFDTSKMEW